MPPTTPAKTSVGSDVSSPRGSGRRRVRAISASIFCSTRQLIAAAAPATSAMPSVAEHDRRGGRQAGRREEHADHRAEHDQRHHARLGQREELPEAAFGEGERGHGKARARRDDDTGVAKASHFTTRGAAAVDAQPIRDARSRRARSLASALDVRIARIGEHEVAERIDQVDRRAAPPGSAASARSGTRATTRPGCCASSAAAGRRVAGRRARRARRGPARVPCIVRACRVA